MKTPNQIKAPLPKDPPWRECPSVLTGGKPSFWVRERGDVREWVSWNKINQVWGYSSESTALSNTFKNFNP